MKTILHLAAALTLSLFFFLPASAQVGRESLERFAGGGVTFQYPAQWTLSDKSSKENLHLVLELKGTAAQIMVLVERTPSTQPGQRGEALQTRTSLFADIMTKELEKLGTTVERSKVTTEAGGVMAEGLKLRASPNNEPGSVEVYAFVLGGRIVMLTLLGPDRDSAAASPAWAAVRSSLRVEMGVAASNASFSKGAPSDYDWSAFKQGASYAKLNRPSFLNRFALSPSR